MKQKHCRLKLSQPFILDRIFQVRSYIKLLKNKNKRKNIKMWDLRFVTLRCRNFSFIIIFLLIGMAYQLILSFRSGTPHPPSRLKNGRENGATKDRGGKERVSSERSCGHVYMAKRMRNATIRQKRPIASDRAKPRMA